MRQKIDSSKRYHFPQYNCRSTYGMTIQYDEIDNHFSLMIEIWLYFLLNNNHNIYEYFISLKILDTQLLIYGLSSNIYDSIYIFFILIQLLYFEYIWNKKLRRINGIIFQHSMYSLHPSQ